MEQNYSFYKQITWPNGKNSALTKSHIYFIYKGKLEWALLSDNLILFIRLNLLKIKAPKIGFKKNYKMKKKE